MTPPEIADYEVLELIGVGGMASVWTARPNDSSELVAIKFLQQEFHSCKEELERFVLEAQRGARMNHDGIVTVQTEAMKYGSHIYFVMEYVSGYSVGDWIRRKGSLSEADAVLVSECIADALYYVWRSQAAIHCDIKPDNIVINSDGTVKIADLGLTRCLVDDSPANEELMIGTPSYMSPELVRGDAEISCQSDMYSLGAMMYHMATGYELFADQDQDDVARLQITSYVEDLLDIAPEFSMGYAWLTEMLLMKNADRRPATWPDVQKQIERVSVGHIPSGEIPGSGMSTMKRSERRVWTPVRMA